MNTITNARFQAALQTLLTEVFSEVEGWVLDKNTSLLETLADVSAAEASVPVGGTCATLAAQVKHIAFYFDFLVRAVQEPDGPAADWSEIWRTVGAVSEAERVAIQEDLRASYGRVTSLIEEIDNWDDERTLKAVMATVAHTAYHLGEIRQALCVLKA
jgi:hypothetical protein